MPLTKTKVAIQQWDSNRAEREARWSKVSCNRDVKECIRLDKIEADLVREAFFQDTQAVNYKENAYMIHPDDIWLRERLLKDRENK